MPSAATKFASSRTGTRRISRSSRHPEGDSDQHIGSPQSASRVRCCDQRRRVRPVLLMVREWSVRLPWRIWQESRAAAHRPPRPLGRGRAHRPLPVGPSLLPPNRDRPRGRLLRVPRRDRQRTSRLPGHRPRKRPPRRPRPRSHRPSGSRRPPVLALRRRHADPPRRVRVAVPHRNLVEGREDCSPRSARASVPAGS